MKQCEWLYHIHLGPEALDSEMCDISTLVRAEAPFTIVIEALGDSTPHLAITASRGSARVIGVAQESEREHTGSAFWIPSHRGHGCNNNHCKYETGQLYKLTFYFFNSLCLTGVLGQTPFLCVHCWFYWQQQQKMVFPNKVFYFFFLPASSLIRERNSVSLRPKGEDVGGINSGHDRKQRCLCNDCTKTNCSKLGHRICLDSVESVG